MKTLLSLWRNLIEEAASLLLMAPYPSRPTAPAAPSLGVVRPEFAIKRVSRRVPLARKALAVAISLALLFTGWPIAVPVARAAVPQLLNFQGKLGDASGNPLTGTFSFRFKFFNAESGGTQLFSEDVTTAANAISVVNGIYSVQIGSVTVGGIPANVFDGSPVYIEIDVNTGTSLAGAETLTPRERVTGSPFAMHSLTSEKLGTGVAIATFTSSGILQLPYGVTAGTASFTGSLTASTITATGFDATGFSLRLSSGLFTSVGTIQAALFRGDGSNLTNIVATTLGSPIAVDIIDAKTTTTNGGITISSHVFLSGSTSRLGVGTTSPTYKLEVVTTGATGARVATTGASIASPALDLFDASAGVELVATANGGNAVIGSKSSAPLHFLTLGTAKAAIDLLGQMGVGTTSPAAGLHISSANAVGSGTPFLVSTGTAAGQELLAVKGDGRIQLSQAGSAASPALNWSLAGTADPDTGFFEPAADILGFATGGAERARISSTGLTMAVDRNIALSGPLGWVTTASSVTASAFFGNGANLTGITATTATNLAGGTANAVPFQTAASATSFTASPAAANQVLFYNGTAPAWSASPTLAGTLTMSGATANIVSGSSITTSGGLFGQSLATNGTLRLDSAGNLTSIGNITGTGALTLQATGGTLAHTATGANAQTFTTNAAERLRIDSAGLVGIATSGPQTTLDVNGNAQFGSGITKSTFSTTGALTLANNAGLTLSGAAGNFTSGSSVTASAFFGNGSQLVGVTATDVGSPITVDLINAKTTTTNGGISISSHVFMTDSNARFAIGTATPDLNARVHIRGNNTTAFGLRMLIDNTATATASYGALVLQGNNGTVVSQAYSDGLGTGPLGTPGMYVGANSNHPLGLFTNNAERVRVTTGGSVGIGTTNPTPRLQIAGTSTSNSFVQVDNTAGGAFQAALGVKDTGGGNANGGFAGTLSAHPFALRTNNLDRAVFDTVGNLGVGTSAPTAGLHVSSSAAVASSTVLLLSTGTAAGQGVLAVKGDGRIQLSQAGTAASPALNWNLAGTADPDTGFFEPAADILGFATGGAERARISSTGLTMAADRNILLSGPLGWVTTASSVTASAFFGNGAGITGITATTATNLAGGTANAVPFQTAASATSFTASPAAANQVLFYNGTAPAWSASPTLAGTLTMSGATANIVSGSSITTSGGLFGQSLEVGNTTSGGDIILRNAAGGSSSVGFYDAAFAGQVQYNHADDSMGFYTAGSGKVFLDANGNLGVGPLTPGGKLHSSFAGAAAGDNVLLLSTGTAAGQNILAVKGDGRVQLTQAGSAASPALNWNLAGTADPDTGFFKPAADNLGFATAGTERVRINSTGNVGIGSTNPGAQLEVGNTTSGGDIILRNAAGGSSSVGFYDAAFAGQVQYNHADDSMGFYTAGSGKVFLDANGNLGVGPLTPGGKLHSSFAGAAAGDNVLLLSTGTAAGQNILAVKGDGRVQLTQAGSAASPALNWNLAGTADPDTGFFEPAADILGFATGGVERARISSTGLTMAADRNITLSGPLGWVTTASSVTASAFFGYGGNLTGITATTATNLAGGTANAVPFQTAASATSFTASPAAANQVLFYNGTAPAWSASPTLAGTLTMSGATANIVSGSSITTSGGLFGQSLASNGASPLPILTNSAERMRFDILGQVGIGVTAPTARVHVSSAGAVAADTVFLVSSGTAVGQELLVIRGNARGALGVPVPAAAWHVRSGGSDNMWHQAMSATSSAGYRMSSPDGDYFMSISFTGNPVGSFAIHDQRNAQTRFQISTGGNAGIGTGTASASARLQVSSASAVAADTVLLVSTGTAAGQELLAVKGDGRIQLSQAGTAASPALNWSLAGTADPDTGFFEPAADILGFATGGAERARISSTGLTMAADRNITLSGPLGWVTTASSVTASAFFGNGANLTGIIATTATNLAGGTANAVPFQTAASATSFTASPAAANQVLFYNGTAPAWSASPTLAGTLTMSGATANIVSGSSITTSGGLFGQSLSTNGTLRLDASGNLTSIGNITGTGAVTLQATGGTLALTATGANIQTFSTNAGERMRIDSTGLVGINTNGPQTRLDVNGDAQFGSGITKSTFTATGGLNLATNAALRLTGPSGFLISGSSVIASAFYGDGTGITGIVATDSTKVLKAGDTMTGQLTINGSSLTAIGSVIFRSTTTTTVHPFVQVQNNAGAEILRVQPDARVGVGSAVPAARLHVSSTSAAFTDVLFLVSSGTAAGQQLLSVKGDGKVGVGTTTPGAELEISKTADASVGTSVINLNAGASAQAYYLAQSDAGRTRLTAISLAGGGGGTLSNDSAGGLRLSATGGSAPIAFLVNGGAQEAARFRSTGQLGIGTTLPNYPLHVVGSAGTQDFAIVGDNSASTSANLYIGGVYGQGGAFAYGVFGKGPAGGVFGKAEGPSVGVFGEADGGASSYFGVLGQSTATVVGLGGGLLGVHYPGGGLGGNGDAIGVKGQTIRDSGNTGLRVGVWGAANDGGTVATSSDFDFYGETANGQNYFAGAVGIGNTAPGITKLWVQGAQSSAFHVRVSSQNSTGSILAINRQGDVGVGTTGPGANVDIQDVNGGLALRVSTSATAGVASLAVAANGRVGVGTTIPAARLHVSSSPASSTDAIFQVSSGTAAGQEILHVRGDGRVGIGVTSPGSTLQVRGYDAAATSFAFGAGGASANPAFVVRNDGNVGIGTTSPGANLHVESANGTVRLRATSPAAGSIDMFAAVGGAAQTPTAACTTVAANAVCMLAWTSAGVATTCATSQAAARVLCADFGD